MAARYKIFEQLGVGGAGMVFKGYDTQLERYVALKRLISSEDAAKAVDEAATLRKEASALANLKHPHIVSIYDVSSDDEGLFIVMELLEGDDLAEWLARETLRLEDFKELALQTMEALLYAHSLNILHRDLKPENIKVNRLAGDRLNAKIIDFGLAKLSYSARRQTADQSGCVMGSIHYMAPEQFLRQAVDGRTDLYSIGCVFYQSLAGVRPFDGPTVQEVMDRHIQHVLRPLHELCSDIPQPFIDWTMWLINQDPANRPESAAVALEVLKSIIDADAAEVRAAAYVEPVVEEALPEPPAPVAYVHPVVEKPKSSKAWMMGVGVALMAAVAFFLTRGDGWKPLFNGTDLTGWKGDPLTWSVQNGTIVCAPQRSRTYLILKDQIYKDFILEADVLLPLPISNSGINIRSEILDDSTWSLKGIQTELAPKRMGCLYDDHGRGDIYKPSPALAMTVNPGEWFHFRITVKGPQLQCEVNGKIVTDFEEADQSKVPLEGVIGLESSSGVTFKNIRIKSL